MKVGIIGAGAVGSACTVAMTLRGTAREIVLVNRSPERAHGVVTDLQYGAVLAPAVSLRAGDYEDLHDADIVMITAGANEKSGGATDRDDPKGPAPARRSVVRPVPRSSFTLTLDKVHIREVPPVHQRYSRRPGRSARVDVPRRSIAHGQHQSHSLSDRLF